MCNGIAPSDSIVWKVGKSSDCEIIDIHESVDENEVL